MARNNDTTNESLGMVSRREVLKGTMAAGLLPMLSAPGATTSGTTEVVVRTEDVDIPFFTASASIVDELKATAARSQQPIVEYIEETDGLAVKNRFWLANALLVEVDTATVDYDELVARNGVSEVHPNFAFELPEPEAAAAAAENAGVTYGLDQINVQDAWETYGTRGEGARIAVLDTGVDPSHPDIDITSENFAEFDGEGNRVDSDPHDTHYHGTHTSGTATGGDSSGTAIGVAPEADLLHGLILPAGNGTFAQIIAGMQWAVERNADAMNMSLGVLGYAGQMIEPVRNAERAGTFVVSSSGNSGAGTSGSPANVYDSLAVGATNEDEAVASFSSGETVTTDDAWGHLAPDDWPDSYVVPDVSAPGVDVLSAYPVDHDDGPYNAISGTSMASPHVAGLVGLLTSAAAEAVDGDQLKAALRITASKPDGNPADPDTRYGDGIVDAMASVGRLAAESGVTGTVTDADGAPVEGATVTLDGFPTRTDADGAYTLRAVAGTYDLAVESFGHDDAAVGVDVGDGFVTRDFTLGDDLAAVTAADQPEGLQAGESFDVELRVANVETVIVDRVGDYAGDARLSIAGEKAAFGEPFALDGPTSGNVALTVETGDDGVGDLELEHTLAGLGETVTVTTGPTSVYEDPVPVAIVEGDSGGYAADVRAVLESEMAPRYLFSTLDPETALEAARNRDHEAYVVQSLGSDDDLIEEFASVATAPEVGVVYLDQFGEASDAVSQLSAATGNPRQAFDVYVEQAAPPVEYEVDRTHPVLDDIAEPGEHVAVTEPEPVAVAPGMFLGGFHTYFEEYRGPVTGATLAEVAAGPTASGAGLAVDDLSRIVLAASLGLGRLVGRSALTADGKALLGNLVAHAAKTPPIAVVDAPAEQVGPGETVTASIEVTDLVELTVDVSGLEYVSKSELSLSVDGESVPFGEPIAYDEPHDGTVAVTVATTAGTLGAFALDARFVTLTRADREVETAATFNATTVYESPIRVPDQLDDLQAAVDFVRSGDTVEVGDGTYELDADRGFQTGLYVGTPGITIRGAAGATPEIAHARDLPSPYVINVDADDVTLENLAANVIDGDIDPKNLVGFGIVINEGVSGTTVRDVTAAGTSGVFLDSDVSDVHVEGVTVVGSPGGVSTDLGGGPVEGVTVTDLTFEDPYFFGFGAVYLENASRATVTDCDITYGEGFLAGILLHGDFAGSVDNRIANNDVTGPDATGPYVDNDGINVDGAAVEITDNVVDGAYTGIRVGEFGFGIDPPSVVIEDNTVTNASVSFRQLGDRVSLERNTFEAETGLDLDGGYFGLSANAVVARYNDLSATGVPFVGDPDSGYNAPEGPFDVRLNYLGDRAYGDTIADGKIAYDPFLTAPPAEVDLPEPTRIATDLLLDPGTTYGLGVPGPTDLTIWEVLGVEEHGDFAGTVEYWNAESDTWLPVTGDGELAAIDTLDAFRVTPTEGVRAVVDFQRRGDTPLGLRDPSPDEARLRAGRNFVAAPAYGATGEVFDASVVDDVSAEFESPAGQFGDAERDAFTGYRVSAAEDATLAARLDAYDPTMAELYESLGLDPVIHDRIGPDAAAAGVTPTVGDVLAAIDDEEIAADAVATLLRERIARRLEAGDDLEAVAEEIETVTTAAVGDAPSDAAAVVEAATFRAATTAIRASLRARTVTDDEDEFRTELARTAENRSEESTVQKLMEPAALD